MGTTTTTPPTGGPWATASHHRDRPAVVDPGRRGVPVTDLRRLPGNAVPSRAQRLEHHPADRLGRTRRHLRPRTSPAVPPPDPSAPRESVASRSTAPATGSRPSSSRHGWPKGAVFNDEYRHTSLIATLRERGTWATRSQRDAAARTFSHVFTLDPPRDPQTWPDPEPGRCPVPDRQIDRARPPPSRPGQDDRHRGLSPPSSTSTSRELNPAPSPPRGSSPSSAVRGAFFPQLAPEHEAQGRP